jgi:hypothetical protein
MRCPQATCSCREPKTSSQLLRRHRTWRNAHSRVTSYLARVALVSHSYRTHIALVSYSYRTHIALVSYSYRTHIVLLPLTRSYKYKELLFSMPSCLPPFAFGMPLVRLSVVPQQQQPQQPQSPQALIHQYHSIPISLNSPLPLPTASSGPQPSASLSTTLNLALFNCVLTTVPSCILDNTITSADAAIKCRSICTTRTQAFPPLAHNPSTPEINTYPDIGPHALAPCPYPLLPGPCRTRPT